MRVIIPARRESTRKAFDTLCSELGFSLLKSPANWIACGGQLGERRIVICLVTSRSSAVPLPPRIDILLEAGFSHPMIQSGGVLLRPGKAAILNGPPAATRSLADALTPEIRSGIDMDLKGRFAMSTIDSMARDSVFRKLTEERWPGGWSGLIVQTWVSLDADRATLASAIQGLGRVRDRLQRAMRGDR